MLKIDEATQPDDVRREAQRLYEVYTGNSDGLNYQGLPCPEWGALPTAIRSHWCAVALAASLGKASIVPHPQATLEPHASSPSIARTKSKP